MTDAAEWWKQGDNARRPWLVLDNGATLARRGDFDLSAFRILATPAAARELGSSVPVDVVLGREDATLKGANGDTIATYKPATLTGRGEKSDAVEAIWLLASLGAKTIRFLGIDPGPGETVASPAYTETADAIAAAIQKFDLMAGPLTAEVPARLYIGSDPSQALGAKMLEYTVRKHSTLTTQFDTMQHVQVPMPKDPRNQPRTQFSFNRFAIPSLAGYRGRGLYVDADMQVFHDLRELWEMPFANGSKAMYAPPSDPKRPPQTSVMLLDCANLTWDVKNIVRDLDEEKYDYEGLMRDMKLEPPGTVQDLLPPIWNSLEEYAPNKTRLIHYTDMKTQPWVSRRNPNGDLWVKALREAIAEGFVTVNEVREAVAEGYVRPSLLGELKIAPAQWPLYRKVAGPLLDLRYKPHRQLRKRLSKAGIGVSG